MLRLGRAEQQFRCFRCRRDMPEDQYQIISEASLPGVIWLHPWCRTCRKQARSEHVAHPLYCPSLHRFVTQSLGQLRGGAKSRSIAFGIDADDLLGLYLKQDGRCALTGIPMTFKRGTRHMRAPTAASCDRVNPRGNYTLDNIRMVCRAVNIMKGPMLDIEFGHWCKIVVMHALEQLPSR